MNVKSIIFSLSSLIVLIGGSLLFENMQEKIKDTTWLIVVSKVIVAILLLVIYFFVVKWFAGIFNIDWKGE